MKSKKVEKTEKKEKKVKVKVSKSPRVVTETKAKASALTADRICNRCKLHDMIRSVKGHKCPEEILSCNCDKCADYLEKTRRKNENRKRRKIDKNASKDKSKTDSKTFVKSLKNKSKKILLKSSSKTKGRRSKTGVGNGMKLAEFEERPPALQRQTDDPMDANHLVDVSHTSSSTDINPSNEPDVAKSSAPLCAKYLKACEEFSRKLSNFQLTQDEMIACFKYSMVRDCLGDVEMAAQKIAFASQEIRLGAVYNIQYPNDEQTAEQTSSHARGHTSTAHSSHPPVLCSTYNQQYVPTSGVHYSPTFTPIRRK